MNLRWIQLCPESSSQHTHYTLIENDTAILNVHNHTTFFKMFYECLLDMWLGILDAEDVCARFNDFVHVRREGDQLILETSNRRSYTWDFIDGMRALFAALEKLLKENKNSYTLDRCGAVARMIRMFNDNKKPLH